MSNCNNRRKSVDWIALGIFLIGLIFGVGVLYAQFGSLVKFQDAQLLENNINHDDHAKFRESFAEIRQALKDNNGILRQIAEQTKRR